MLYTLIDVILIFTVNIGGRAALQKKHTICRIDIDVLCVPWEIITGLDK